MVTVHPYIAFADTKAALAYYEEVFGAKNVVRVPVGAEQAGQFGVDPEKAADMTMHAQFDVLGATIYGADNFIHASLTYDSFTIHLNLDSEDAVAVAEADAFFEKVAASGKAEVTMPYADQFWGGKMGAFRDQFGINWAVHAEPYSTRGQY